MFPYKGFFISCFLSLFSLCILFLFTSTVPSYAIETCDNGAGVCYYTTSPNTPGCPNPWTKDWGNCACVNVVFCSGNWDCNSIPGMVDAGSTSPCLSGGGTTVKCCKPKVATPTGYTCVSPKSNNNQLADVNGKPLANRYCMSGYQCYVDPSKSTTNTWNGKLYSTNSTDLCFNPNGGTTSQCKAAGGTCTTNATPTYTGSGNARAVTFTCGNGGSWLNTSDDCNYDATGQVCCSGPQSSSAGQAICQKYQQGTSATVWVCDGSDTLYQCVGPNYNNNNFKSCGGAGCHYNTSSKNADDACNSSNTNSCSNPGTYTECTWANSGCNTYLGHVPVNHTARVHTCNGVAISCDDLGPCSNSCTNGKDTQITLSIKLDGIGATTFENNNPKAPTKQSAIRVYDPSSPSTSVVSNSPTVIFGKSDGKFSGSAIDLKTTLSCSTTYKVDIKFPGYLPATADVKYGDTTQIISVEPIPGDINQVDSNGVIIGDGKIDINDYSLFRQCRNVSPTTTIAFQSGAKTVNVACSSLVNFFDFQDGGTMETVLTPAGIGEWDANYNLWLRSYIKANGL